MTVAKHRQTFSAVRWVIGRVSGSQKPATAIPQDILQGSSWGPNLM